MGTYAFTKKCMWAILRVVDNLIGNYKISKATLLSKGAPGADADAPLNSKLLKREDICAIINFAWEEGMVETMTGYKEDFLIEVVSTENWGAWRTKRGVKLFKGGVF
jgi:hypothetical protein